MPLADYYTEHQWYNDAIKSLEKSLNNKTRISGIVERKITRTTGKGIMFAVVVDNIQYGCYTTDPKCNEGDSVEFLATANGQYWNMDVKSLQVKAPAAAPRPTATGAVPTTKPAWVPDKDRQDAISYQAARKDALEMVSTLLAAGVLDLGKSKTAAGKIAAVETYVDKYTIRFFEDTKNLGHKTVEDAPETKEDNSNFVDDDIPF